MTIFLSYFYFNIFILTVSLMYSKCAHILQKVDNVFYFKTNINTVTKIKILKTYF